MSDIQVVGVWKLVDYRTILLSNKQISYPYGQNPKGYMIYTQTGFVSVQIMRAHRTKAKSIEEEKIEMAENFGAYFGRYEIRGTQIIHYPEVCGFLSYLNIPQKREIRFEGNKLILEYDHPSQEHSLVKNPKLVARSIIIWELLCAEAFSSEKD